MKQGDEHRAGHNAQSSPLIPKAGWLARENNGQFYERTDKAVIIAVFAKSIA